MTIRLFAAFAALWLLAVPAVAQNATPAPEGGAAAAETNSVIITKTRKAADADIDYVALDALAQRVEEALETGRVSGEVLETLRNDLSDWRKQMAEAKQANSVRIRTLKAQITALGKPVEGADELETVAEQRAELTKELNRLTAPVTRATVAWARANALISAIDASLRGRQTADLTTVAPSPLSPANWPPALTHIKRTFRLAFASVHTPGAASQFAMSENALLASLLGTFSLLLLLFGRRIMLMACARMQRATQWRSQVVWGFLLSLGQIVVPVLGAIGVAIALREGFVPDRRADAMVLLLPQLALFYFCARWISRQILGPADTSWTVLTLSGFGQREGRLLVVLLGTLTGVSFALDQLSQVESYRYSTTAMLRFPLIVAVGVLLFRFGQLLRRPVPTAGIGAQAGDDAESAGQNLFNTTLAFIGMAAMAVGVAGPAIAAFGYSKLGALMVFPSVLTLGVVALLVIIHHFNVDLYAAIRRFDRERASNALLPVLFSLVFVFAAAPLLALIWGARESDLTEMWARFVEGIPLGDSVLKPQSILIGLVVFGAAYALTRLVQGALNSTILPRTKLDAGGRNAITAGVGYIGIALAAVVGVSVAGINLSSLAIVAGALSVGLGFGMQNIVENFVSGIILLIERPISEGDMIDVNGQMGRVRDISVRSTRIETFDRTEVILPNSDLISGMVTNFTRGNTVGRVIVPVGVAYGTDTHRVEEILLEVAKAHPMVLVDPAPSVAFRGFGADSLDFEIRAILSDVKFKMSTHSQMNHEIARRFAEEGIEIPFAQRDIWLRNPEVLPGAAAKAEAAPVAPQKAKSEYKTPDVEDMSDDDDR